VKQPFPPFPEITSISVKSIKGLSSLRTFWVICSTVEGSSKSESEDDEEEDDDDEDVEEDKGVYVGRCLENKRKALRNIVCFNIKEKNFGLEVINE